MVFGEMPPDEKALVEKLQAGLPVPKNDGAGLVLLKREALSSVLSSGSVTPVQFMVAALAAANELPAGVKKVGVVQAVFNAATLGLMFGSVRGEAYLVPYKDKKASDRAGTDIYDCNLIIGYKGFRNLAYQTSFLKSFTTEVVLEGEECECWVDETGRRLNHKTPIGREIQPGGANIVAAYCQYATRTGGTGVVVVSKNELAKARPHYSEIWKAHSGPMSMKTAIRRASKEWMVTGNLAGAVVLDEQAEDGLTQTVLFDAKLLEDGMAPPVNRRQKIGVSSSQAALESIKEGAGD